MDPLLVYSGTNPTICLVITSKFLVLDFKKVPSPLGEVGVISTYRFQSLATFYF